MNHGKEMGNTCFQLALPVSIFILKLLFFHSKMSSIYNTELAIPQLLNTQTNLSSKDYSVVHLCVIFTASNATNLHVNHLLAPTYHQLIGY